MTHISTINEAIHALSAYIPLTREVTGKDITLERMAPLMAAVGNPQEKLKIIHVAGTSGKTSTTYYVTSLLVKTGKKVGTTVSPHIDSITERVQINGQPLDEATFCKELSIFLDLVVEAKIEPTYFEILIAFVYWYFQKVGVDYAVIETGLGGLHDGTNVAESEDKVCVITDIGYDHMNVLGNTIEDIAKQKAGIIWRGNHVFMYKQIDAVISIVDTWCQEKDAQLTLLDQPHLDQVATTLPSFKNLPAFQQRNFLLAFSAYEYVASRDGLAALDINSLEKALAVKVPARMDISKVGNKKIIMDGAHNGQKMGAFTSSFIQLFPGKRADVLLSLKKGKEFSEVLPLLLPITNTLIVCDFNSVQDTYINAIDPQELADAAFSLGFEKVIIERDPSDAYEKLLNSPMEIAVITGSFYLIGELRHLYKELINA